MRKGEGKAEFLWGDATLPELLAQPEPRLISTHLFGDLLPTQLTDPNHGCVRSWPRSVPMPRAPHARVVCHRCVKCCCFCT